MSPQNASVEGTPAVGDDTTGSLIVELDGVQVFESFWAGSYYCAHVLWQSSTWARAAGTTVALDAAGDPLVGFLHVPGDPETEQSPDARPRPKRERHARTMRILTWALRGFLKEIAGQPEQRILLTGFGRFGDVTSNPTGELVGDGALVAAILRDATDVDPRAHRVDYGVATLEVHEAGPVRLGRLVLDVNDSALDDTCAGSLPFTLARFRPHAVISLGVHRSASMFRVEVQPTTAGLEFQGDRLRHAAGAPTSERLPINLALARAILRGARAAT